MRALPVRMLATRQAVIVLGLAILASTCGTWTGARAAEPDSWASWSAAARKAHPAAGRVLTGDGKPVGDGDGADGTAVWASALSQVLAGGGIVLLGEVHDNAGHHQLRALLLREMLRGGGRRPALVLEHVTTEQSEILAQRGGRPRAALGAAPARAEAEALLRDLDWSRSGWPDAAMFVPLFEAATQLELPLVAGNVARSRVRAVARQGLSVLSVEQRSALGLDTALPVPLAEALAAELAGSHCGMLPASAIPNMSAAQRFRDAHMAARLIEAARANGGSILLAGNGHVRSDRGVPWHVRQRAPGLGVVAVALVEVDDASTHATAGAGVQDHVQLGPGGLPVFDFIILTPRATRADPCKSMRPAGQQKR